ncbi:hypothetical protein CPB85DRAFT_1332633 [Mucidula mucida]|nr:hypothetical protein CPB85DRAFT_1332598 [Mucidula mucida]KAF8891058.1 hypothetical protein CPB85DRAFT_1332633 [Mucidula mucida]
MLLDPHVDGEVILFRDTFVLCQRCCEDEHNVTITESVFQSVYSSMFPSLTDGYIRRLVSSVRSTTHTFPRNSPTSRDLQTLRFSDLQPDYHDVPQD